MLLTVEFLKPLHLRKKVKEKRKKRKRGRGKAPLCMSSSAKTAYPHSVQTILAFSEIFLKKKNMGKRKRGKKQKKEIKKKKRKKEEKGKKPLIFFV